MKKIVYALLISCLSLLGACTATDTNKLTIPELSERETQILETAADKAFVFDFTTDQNYTELSLWVEKYEKGKKVEDPVNDLSSPLPGESTKGSIVFTISQTLDQQLLLSASIRDADGTVRINNQEKLASLDHMATLWGTTPLEGVTLSDNMLLAGVIYTDTTSGKPTSGFSQDFYEQKENYLDELKEHDVVYLLRVSFEK
ncbi:hypothetical protein DV702_14465 [Sporosarcina sp. PTS2304]|uniref:hypothetical protein n=1 Tax=Sporosarcina sp. PTS2304 TaxID=2283194 RepID=UPI000E0CD025|nr:hypothetical protein [Sporosarcina sp. PTS2304]AXI00803.1 hypothetical protein DV702_14465 [Sporosarcina sp. PTS2304]